MFVKMNEADWRIELELFHRVCLRRGISEGQPLFLEAGCHQRGRGRDGASLGI
jgi:hypothetical protein